MYFHCSHVHFHNKNYHLILIVVLGLALFQLVKGAGAILRSVFRIIKLTKNIFKKIQNNLHGQCRISKNHANSFEFFYLFSESSISLNKLNKKNNLHEQFRVRRPLRLDQTPDCIAMVALNAMFGFDSRKEEFGSDVKVVQKFNKISYLVCD